MIELDMIRTATIDDIPQIVELGVRLHAESSYSHISFDKEKVAGLMKMLIEKIGVVFVADRDGEIMGGIAGAVTEEWFSREKLAFDYSFFIAPEHRGGMTAIRLMAAFEEWGKSLGAKRISMGITTGIHVDATAKMYQSLGFAYAGPLFSKELRDGN